MVEKHPGAHLELTKKPTGVTVVEGFPGFGLVATIATGFLIEHLDCEQIGKFYFDKSPATVAIHNCEVVQPLGVYYHKKSNLVIIHAISNVTGFEYEAADLVLDVCKHLKAKELICIEGVGSTQPAEEPQAFHYSTTKDGKDRMAKIGISCLTEGIIVGSTGALLLKAPDEGVPLTSIFVDTASSLPDSKAAAKVIETLDKYLELDVPYEPLLKQAEEFEEKLKGIMEQTTKTKDLKQKKDISYVG